MNFSWNSKANQLLSLQWVSLEPVSKAALLSVPTSKTLTYKKIASEYLIEQDKMMHSLCDIPFVVSSARSKSEYDKP